MAHAWAMGLRWRGASPHHEEPPQGGVSNGDFTQDEGVGECQKRIVLIPSEVEGRVMPMQDALDELAKPFLNPAPTR